MLTGEMFKRDFQVSLHPQAQVVGSHHLSLCPVDTQST